MFVVKPIRVLRDVLLLHQPINRVRLRRHGQHPRLLQLQLQDPLLLLRHLILMRQCASVIIWIQLK